MKIEELWSLFLSGLLGVGDGIIDVRSGRARVSRFCESKIPNLPSGVGPSWEPALNWEELEEEAREAVLDQGGEMEGRSWYSCPSRLFDQAIWEE